MPSQSRSRTPEGSSKGLLAAWASVPAAWPAVKANDRGLQVLVYNKTRDFMRRVSEHVSIGMAFKVEKSLNNWFTLVREDVA